MRPVECSNASQRTAHDAYDVVSKLRADKEKRGRVAEAAGNMGPGCPWNKFPLPATSTCNTSQVPHCMWVLHFVFRLSGGHEQHCPPRGCLGAFAVGNGEAFGRRMFQKQRAVRRLPLLLL